MLDPLVTAFFAADGETFAALICRATAGSGHEQRGWSNLERDDDGTIDQARQIRGRSQASFGATILPLSLFDGN
ncbi:hypothetical protein MKX08_008592 [Trichoderma sp. CBMAI-0020]|nr:hypothetical protein MKX08_008592 [Trichoderma sp. CBMAI-0020]